MSLNLHLSMFLEIIHFLKEYFLVTGRASESLIYDYLYCHNKHAALKGLTLTIDYVSFHEVKIRSFHVTTLKSPLCV